MIAPPESDCHISGKEIKTAGVETMREIAFDLRSREARWLAGKGQVPGPILPLHPPSQAADIDHARRIPCYGVNSLHPTSTDYLQLARMLGPEQPFFSIHPPSQKRRAESAGSIPQLAKYYVDALVQFQPEGPLALVGWSVGAVLALEMAQQLKTNHGREVNPLIAIDFGPLNTPADKRPFRMTEKLAHFYFEVTSPIKWIFGAFKREPSFYAATLAIWKRAKWSAARRKAIREEVKRVPPRHPAELRLSIFPYIPRDGQEYVKALYTAAEEYVPAKYSGPVVVYVSTAQPLRLERRVEEKWRDIADSVEVVEVKGTHESMINTDDGKPLAEHLLSKLEEVSLAEPKAATESVPRGANPQEVA